MRESLRQDDGAAGREATLRMRGSSAPFLVLFALTVTFASFDWLMSLDPHWFSTIFGVYVFSGMTLAALAAISLAACSRCARAGRIPAATCVTPDHLYNLGALLFAFTCFWAYIAFSQYMLIWYANLPEETVWFLRPHGGRLARRHLLLAVLRFVVPFFLLLCPRGQVRPAAPGRRLRRSSSPDSPWTSTGCHPPACARTAAPLAGGGRPAAPPRWAPRLAVAAFLRRHPVVAVGDPLLDAARASTSSPPAAPMPPCPRPPPVRPAPRRGAPRRAPPRGRRPPPAAAERPRRRRRWGWTRSSGRRVPLRPRLPGRGGEGRAALGDLLVRPTVLTLVYFRCPCDLQPRCSTSWPAPWTRCDLVPGVDYDLLTVCFDDREKPTSPRPRSGTSSAG